MINLNISFKAGDIDVGIYGQKLEIRQRSDSNGRMTIEFDSNDSAFAAQTLITNFLRHPCEMLAVYQHSQTHHYETLPGDCFICKLNRRTREAKEALDAIGKTMQGNGVGASVQANQS